MRLEQVVAKVGVGRGAVVALRARVLLQLEVDEVLVPTPVGGVLEGLLAELA